MSEQHTTPPYSEEQATEWLAWLAYNMQKRDQTIFQIENLQPVWLAGRKETGPYLLSTRMLWGALSGLIGGGIFQMIGGLISGFIGGLNVGLIVGLSGGLIEMVTPYFRVDARLRNHGNSIMTLLLGTTAYGLLVGLLVGLIWGLIEGVNTGRLVGVDVGLYAGRILGLERGLIVGLTVGLIRTSRIALRGTNTQLAMVESLQWSWKNTRRNARYGYIVGQIVGLFVGLLEGLIEGSLLFGLFGGLLGWLIGGLLGWLIGGLLGGFQPVALELKAHPNHGIWLTIRSSIKISLPSGLIVGVLLGVLLGGITVGLGYGITTAFIVGLWYGGLDVIEHGIIRLIIAWRGHAPLNYARFLDYAAEELNFLQKVGGGYVFIHRYLLEHFAEIAVERGYVEGE
ncbi:MAG: hypothetical protein R3A44_12950 [Caldilineaceae bacterium]